jgi:hypothetical protein
MSITSRFRRILGLDKQTRDQIVGTYLNLRVWMAALAFALPIVLCIGGQLHAWIDHPLELQNSLSAYYHAVPLNQCPNSHLGVYRDLFVGILTAISICLITYRGYTQLENWMLNFAGFFLALVAFFPMGWPPKENNCGVTHPGSLLFGWPGVQIHFVAAGLFFVLLILTVFVTSKETLKQRYVGRNLGAKGKALWTTIYNALSLLMLTPPTILAIGKFVIPSWHASVLWAELSGIIFFAVYWVIKTVEIWSNKVSDIFTSKYDE